ncbi:tetratricopeptide repeat protein [Pseudochelatococcus lubricantis]|uniref:tetratricopeptide repeat protein n=1 Tax=Pseudochelatococcus lubricantis TaxID=1538102 RepID=UPI0035F048A0
MSANSPIAALRIANEGFLVASTIERCPKTMMLRELVMNALEAAGTAPAGQQLVDIRPRMIDGVRKLSIWNTGLGMTATELHRICDLASSLHKVNALDRNFGMGAKVASLPSNKYGLRYRSCRNGVVSEVTMGQRHGIYGRIPYREAASAVGSEVDDVTALCRFEGDYNLSSDWTEVVLFGNRQEQDTWLNPYDNDPSVPPDWSLHYLARRFFRTPAGVSLTVSGGAPGLPDRVFVPAEARFGRMHRIESVSTVGGIVIHYGYEPVVAPDADGIRIAGQVSLVYRGEIYAIRQQQEWLQEAPLFGIPFGAGHFTVFIELPDDFEVQPDLYRQFLRFRKGDQRQVHAGDFAPLVRDGIPAWLRQIIASYGPAQVDFLGDLKGELQELLAELGIAPQYRGTGKVRGMPEEAKEPQPPVSPPGTPPSSPPRPPAQQTFEKPPEIIALSDEAQIDERGLQGRVAKYYPATHQLFVNLTYSAVARMAAQLEHAFEAAPGGEARGRIARDLAERAITRKVSRAVIYSLGKKAVGWLPDEISRVQSPESLSIVADDYAPLLPAAHQRMAAMLGIDAPSGAVSAPTRVSLAQRLIGELADARQAARRALQTPTVNPVPILRRVSNIEAQRRNWAAAVDWAQQALDAGPADGDSYLHLARMQQQKGDLDLSEATVRKALDLGLPGPSRYLRHVSALAQQRGEPAQAAECARQARDIEPADAGAHHHLIGLLLQQNDLDAAEEAVETALAQHEKRPGPFIRHQSNVAGKRRELARAVELARRALEADASDVESHHHLIGLLLQQNDFAGAEEAIAAGLALHGDKPARFIRHRSNLAVRRGDPARAVEFARHAVDADPLDAGMHHHLIGLLLQQNDLDAAEEAVETALAQHQKRPGPFIRHQSNVAGKRRELARAVELARRALEADATDVESHHHLIGLLLQQNEFDAAGEAIAAGLVLHGYKPSRFIRHQSNLAARRRDPVLAVELARRAVDVDPSDAGSHHHLIGLLLQQNDLDAAEEAVETALRQHGNRPAAFIRHLSNIATRRRDPVRAVGLARRALEADASDVESRHHLIGLLLQQNDFAGAEEAIAAGLALHGDKPARFIRHRSNLAVRRGDPALAVELARHAVEADPFDAGMHHHLIGLLLQQNDLDAAEEAVETALRQYGNRPAAFIRHLSNIATRRRDPVRAAELALHALEADASDAESHHHLIGLLLQQNDFAGAEEAIAAGLALHGYKPSRFIRHQSNLAARRRDPALAVELARRAVDVDPSDAGSHHHLIGLLLQQNELDVAEQAIAAGLALHGHQRAMFLRHQSNLAAKRREPARAVDLARQSLEINSADTGSHHHLIGLLLQQNDLDAAEEASRAGLTVNGEKPGPFLRQLSKVEARRKNMGAAVLLARQSLEADPSDPWSHDYLIGLLLQSGDLDEAERAAHAALRLGAQNGPDFNRHVTGIDEQRNKQAAA